MATKKVYALLVGINDYPAGIQMGGSSVFGKLRGCVPDVRAMEAWLRSRPDVDLQLCCLTDARAVKQAIVDAFEQHLSQAGPADSVLFFFAGHGALERADASLWPSETDGQLECIVCYPEAESGFLLADKELRWLLHRLYTQTGAHITAIFDSCHSGDNVRAAYELVTARPRMRRAHDGTVFAARPWSEFVFAQALDAEGPVTQVADERLPEGCLVQLSAAESNQSAVEQAGRGAFSLYLLRILEQAATLPDYRQLMSLVGHAMRYRYDQRPRMYSPAHESKDLLATTFLNLADVPDQRAAFMTFQPARGGHYLVNRGAIHGLQAGYSEVVATEAGINYRAQVSQVAIDQAELSWDAAAAAALGSGTRAVCIEGLRQVEARLHLAGDQQPNRYFDQLLDQWPAELQLTEQETKAHWVLHRQGGWWWLALPGHAWQPLVTPLQESASAPEKMLAYLRHLARHQLVSQLHNPDQRTAIEPGALTIEAFEVQPDGSEQLISLQDDAWHLRFHPESRGGKQNIRIKISHTGHQADLYVAALILGHDYSVRSQYLLNPSTSYLEAGQHKWLRDHKGSHLALAMEACIYWYQWPEAVDKLLFVYSDHPFDLGVLSMGALPGPFLPEGEPLRAGRDSLPAWADRLKGISWQSRKIALRIANPWYDKMPSADRQRALQDPKTAFWASRLLGG